MKDWLLNYTKRVGIFFILFILITLTVDTITGNPTDWKKECIKAIIIGLILSLIPRSEKKAESNS